MGYDATSGEEILQDNPIKLKPKFFWLNGKGQNRPENGHCRCSFQNCLLALVWYRCDGNLPAGRDWIRAHWCSLLGQALTDADWWRAVPPQPLPSANRFETPPRWVSSNSAKRGFC